MAKCSILEPIVRDILTQYPETRDDDYLLILKVFDVLNSNLTVDTTNLSVEAVFKNHAQLQLPSMHSITRVRRKIQEIELFSDKGKKRRKEEIKDYKEYAKI